MTWGSGMRETCDCSLNIPVAAAFNVTIRGSGFRIELKFLAGANKYTERSILVFSL
jgi:hypothetical protein